MENGNDKRQFVLVDPLKLESILKHRLPDSAHVYNAAKFYQKWSDITKWYVLDGDISENSWIVAIVDRPDHGQEISVSRNLKSTITPDIRRAFSSCNCIDWSASFLFCAIDVEVSKMVSEISTRDYGNCTSVHPCNLYAMDVEQGLLLNDNFNLEDGVEVKDLNDELQLGDKFILSTWKYAMKRSDIHVRNCVLRNRSSGVYVNGNPVSGVLFASHGLVGMLYTLKEHRGKGYGKYTMHYLMKNLAKNGFVPSCTVELRNEISKAFQTKIGFKVACVVDYVAYEKTEF